MLIDARPSNSYARIDIGVGLSNATVARDMAITSSYQHAYAMVSQRVSTACMISYTVANNDITARRFKRECVLKIITLEEHVYPDNAVSYSSSRACCCSICVYIEKSNFRIALVQFTCDLFA